MNNRAAQGDGDDVLERLRKGDEAAFRTLVRKYHTSMVNFARSFLRDRSSAEEAVQDTWIAIISGIASFEGRSSLKSWMFAIVANKARTKATRDGRMVPFASFGGPDEPAVDVERFTAEGSWQTPPASWSDISPERIVAGRQLLAHVMAVVETLPAAQRTVVLLRDIEGLDAPDVCAMLEISEANQRILLHRGRSRVRQAIENLLADEKSSRTEEEPAGGSRMGS